MLSAVYAVVVCLCVSVTLRYCIKTAKRRITQTTPHDSPMTLVKISQQLMLDGGHAMDGGLGAVLT